MDLTDVGSSTATANSFATVGSRDKTLHVTTLNALAIVQNNRNISMMLSNTAQLLLIYLLTTAQSHPREALAELFWPERQAKLSASNLRTLLSALRKVCGDQLVITRTMVAVDPSNIIYDVANFHAHVTAAQVAVQNGTPHLAVPDWEAAVRLHQRPFLSGIREPGSAELQLWLTLERELRYHQMLSMLRQLVGYHTTQGNQPAALAFAQRWLAFEPHDVEALQAVLRLLAAAGEAATALTHYQRFRQAYQRELGVLPENATLAALVKEITAVRDQGPAQSLAVKSQARPPAAVTEPRSNQAQASDHFAGPLGAVYGRAAQIKRIVDKLRGNTERLISLVGMGGVGKTVLAQAIGKRLQQEFQAGVCFVSLADLPAENGSESGAAVTQQVALAIAAAVGLTVRDDGEVMAALQAHLQPLALLLILDNCEQLIGIAPFLQQLLQHAPQLRLLLTARIRLNLTNERVELVDTLPLPPTPPRLATMADNPSVQLFVARAEQQLSTFTLDAENMAAIHQICCVLGGLPLALEMAAYWITLYTPQEIAATVAQESAFLTRQTNDGPQRQRSIAEVFNYSWQLLAPAEQHMLITLCIFQSTFDRQAALTVTACTTRELSTLIHCALLEVKSPGVYALHPLIKTFAAARGVIERAATARYIAYFFERLPPSDGTLPATPPNQPAAALSTQHTADLAHAWELAVTQQDDEQLGQVLPRFSYFWWVIGRPRTGIRLLRRLQQRLEGEAKLNTAQQQLLGATLHQTMRLAYILLADLSTALTDGERALALLTPCGTALERGSILLDLGNLYVSQARATEAEVVLAQVLAIAEQEQSLRLQIGTLVVLSRIAWARGNWEAAATYGQKALAAVPPLGNAVKDSVVDAPPEITDLLWEMFNQALLRHDIKTAEQIYQHTCSWGSQHTIDSNQQGQQREMAFSLAVVQERWDDAYVLAQSHLAAIAEQDNPQAYASALTALAMTTQHVDTPTTALGFAEQALAIAMTNTEPFAVGSLQVHLVLGDIKATLGRIAEAEHHFHLVLEQALAHKGELYALRNLLGSLFRFAKLKRAKLAPALFAHVVATVAAQPQSATRTRTEAARLAEREGVDLAAAKEQAGRAVDWVALEGLVRLVQRQIDGE